MKGLVLLVIGLFFGTGLGVFLAASQGWVLEGHDHSDPAHHGAGADHAHEATVAAPGGMGLSATVLPDPAGGYDLSLSTPGLTFAPAAGRSFVPGEGHAHVYIDGVKLGRFYSPVIHLPTGGEVRVTLNANDHRVYETGGSPVEVRMTLD